MVDFSKLPRPTAKGAAIKKSYEDAKEAKDMAFKLKTNNEIAANMLDGTELRGKVIETLGKNFSEQMLNYGVGRTCLNCDDWNTDGSYGSPSFYDRTKPEGCKRFKLMPPPKILVKGCPDHSDQIPF